MAPPPAKKRRLLPTVALKTRVDELVQRGQECYRRKEYTAALKALDKVSQPFRIYLSVYLLTNQAILESNGTPPITAYDNRAAVYIKLKQLPKALVDGRHMINNWSQNGTVGLLTPKIILLCSFLCQGYLRTGQILQLQKQQTLAYDIYLLGLRKLPKDSSELKVSDHD